MLPVASIHTHSDTHTTTKVEQIVHTGPAKNGRGQKPSGTTKKKIPTKKICIINAICFIYGSTFVVVCVCVYDVYIQSKL